MHEDYCVLKLSVVNAEGVLAKALQAFVPFVRWTSYIEVII